MRPYATGPILCPPKRKPIVRVQAECAYVPVSMDMALVCRCRLHKTAADALRSPADRIERLDNTPEPRFKCTLCELPIAYVGRNEHLELPALAAVRGGIDKHHAGSGRFDGRWQCGVCSAKEPSLTQLSGDAAAIAAAALNVMHGMARTKPPGMAGRFQRWCPTPKPGKAHCQSAANACSCLGARPATKADRDIASLLSGGALGRHLADPPLVPVATATAEPRAEPLPLQQPSPSGARPPAPAPAQAVQTAAAPTASEPAGSAPAASAAAAALAPAPDEPAAPGVEAAPLGMPHRGRGYLNMYGFQAMSLEQNIAELAPGDPRRAKLEQILEQLRGIFESAKHELESDEFRSFGDSPSSAPVLRTPLLDALDFASDEGCANLLALALMQPEAVGPPPDKRVVVLPAPARPPAHVLQECAAVREALDVDDLLWLQAVSLQRLPRGLLRDTWLHIAGPLGEAEAQQLAEAVAEGPPLLILLSAPSSSQFGEQLARAGAQHVVSWATDCGELPRRLFAEGFWAAVRDGELPDAAREAGKGRVRSAQTQRAGEWVPMLELADPASCGEGRLANGRWAAGFPVLHVAPDDVSTLPSELLVLAPGCTEWPQSLPEATAAAGGEAAEPERTMDPRSGGGGATEWFLFLADAASGRAAHRGFRASRFGDDSGRNPEFRGCVQAEFWFDYGETSEQRYVIVHLHFEGTWAEYVRQHRQGVPYYENTALARVTGLNVRHSTRVGEKQWKVEQRLTARTADPVFKEVRSWEPPHPTASGHGRHTQLRNQP